jgi:Protein of unknown function (DUF3551)
MRLSLYALAVLCTAAAFSAPAQAQNYPWCAYYGGRDSGASNCGFSTFQQCMATVSGIGGFCQRNNLYDEGRGAHRKYRYER